MKKINKPVFKTTSHRIFGLGSTAFDFLQGMPGWEYIQTFLMGGHSSMQVARVAMEAQLRMYQRV